MMRCATMRCILLVWFMYIYIHTRGQNILTLASFRWTDILSMYIGMVVGINSALITLKCYSNQCPNHIFESFVRNATVVYVNSLPPLGHSTFVRATPIQWSGEPSSATDCRWVLVHIQVSHFYVYRTQCYTKRSDGFCLVGKIRGSSGLSRCLDSILSRFAYHLLWQYNQLYG